MAKNNSWGEGILPSLDASSCLIDPYKRLGAAVCLQAVKDFQDNDWLTAIEAFDWFFEDGFIWLLCIGFDVGDDPVDVVYRIAGGS